MDFNELVIDQQVDRCLFLLKIFKLQSTLPEAFNSSQDVDQFLEY